MGIEKFYKTFLVRCADAISDGTATQEESYYSEVMDNSTSLKAMLVSEVHIDANTLIYEAVNAVYLKGETFGEASADDVDRLNKRDKESLKREAFELVFDLIVEIINYFAPRDLVSVYIDGCPPWAKIMQQKQRRYKASLGLGRRETFDTNSITSGSLWMQELDRFLSDKIAQNSSSENWPKRVTYSSHLVKGEGEHKLIRTLASTARQETSRGAIVIYGNDSDLVLLSILTKVTDAHVCSGITSEKVAERAKKTGLVPRRPNRYNVVNVGAMRGSVMFHMGLDDESQSIADFVLLVTLVGNDFIPRPFAYDNVGDTIFNAVRAYKLVDSPLVVGGEIIWESFFHVLGILSSGDETVLSWREMTTNRASELAETSVLVKRSADEDGVFSYELFDENWYQNALGTKNGYGNPSEKLYGPETVLSMCAEFLRGMAWTIAYYTNPSRASKTWYYPFHYAPTVDDLYHFLIYLNENGPDVADYLDPKSGEDGDVTVLHQLVAVMPRLSLQFVPEELRYLWLADSEIADTMPSAIIVDTDDESMSAKRASVSGETVISYNKPVRDRPSVPIVPFVDYKRIDRALRGSETPAYLLRNSETKSYVNNNWKERESVPEQPPKYSSRGKFRLTPTGRFRGGRGRGSRR